MNLVDTFAAPFLLGTFLNVFLAGINWMQIITYFNTSRSEENAIYKWVVGIVGLIGTWHTCFNVVGVYNNLVQNYDKLMNLLSIHWSYVLDPVTTAVVAAISTPARNLQTFYAYRIYILSKRSIFIPLLILFLTLSDFTGTNSIIDKVIRYTVTNNGLTAAAAICSSIMFQASSGLWHVLPGTIIIKLYSISLMASLNSHKNLAHDLALSRTGGRGATKLARGGSPKQLLHFPGVNGANQVASFSCQNVQSDVRNPPSLHFKDTPLRHVAKLIGVGALGNGSLGGSASRSTSMRSMSRRRGGSDHHGENSFPVQVTIDTTSTEFQVEQMDWEEKERKKVFKSEEDRTNGDTGSAKASSIPIALPVPTLELTNPPFRIYVEEPDYASSGLEIGTSQSDLLSKV
ncbi:BQ5605_C027g10416 [Microbotryum silenes-dioicae]|uniref:BQ5605_C027g10416 protein n=1 Tax=Microbotryum silenes-dioicae TaxID=796604 RepID=A0A2X0MS16_9BASI|nr:BQ5605_C027g10416 [Microbotryum silenes-dioicae]